MGITYDTGPEPTISVGGISSLGIDLYQHYTSMVLPWILKLVPLTIIDKCFVILDCAYFQDLIFT